MFNKTDMDKMLEEMRIVSPEGMKRAEESYDEMEEMLNQLIVVSVEQARSQDENAPFEFALSVIIKSIAETTLEMKAKAVMIKAMASGLDTDEEIASLMESKNHAEEMNTVKGLTMIALLNNMILDLTGGNAIRRMTTEAFIENLLHNAKK